MSRGDENLASRRSGWAMGGDPDIQQRGPAFEATGKMAGLESQAAGSATGIGHCQQQPVFAPRRAGTPSQSGLENPGPGAATGRLGSAGTLGKTPAGGGKFRR